ncbi:tRNA 5-methylaminomethyl-2-thiouridine biosynthesis bifunctional protein MnmC [Acaryochloris thomasi RCC1774]|uniref:tRNA 5-methylaminomethyl-2-thiouridine biosynthesis bifunctional protein MnmC n=1 Tax=Acaryochloris thomasi RCC1774 TaxID=1764569 RepID=A0A2W1JN06_9CYAN|nr:tRNA 5-methylaminomethyl-2-thiouridine biosynthesis bifunctional protein MnmC [Acaryochloris thomasi RCC1774]
MIPTGIPERAQQGQLTILDICYGLGYNSAAALECIWQVNPNCRVTLVALESDGVVGKVAAANNYLQHWSPKIQNDLLQLCTDHQTNSSTLDAQLLIGDARQTIQSLAQGDFMADAIFLDPFSPPHCPQLWTVEFLTQVRHCLHSNGRLATYSCSAAVRTGLITAGFQIGSSSPVGRRTPGTIAALAADSNLPSLAAQELEHLQTRAAVSYRDPMLQDGTDTIRERRRQMQQCSELEPTRQWKNRWLSV